MIGKTVRCVFNFQPETEEDLELKVGDLIRVTSVVNDDWWEGTIKERKGQFPKSYVEECDDVFDLAVAIRSFPGDQEGDLAFTKGDFIVVSEIIDENWMSGYIKGGNHGLFPRAFVKGVSMVETGIEETKIENEPRTTEETEIDSESGADWVDVLENFSAMDSNELNLIAGTKIQVLRDVDDFWCEGRDESGAEGMFPRNFVDLPEIAPPVEVVEESSEDALSVVDVVVETHEDSPIIDAVEENLDGQTKSENEETENEIGNKTDNIIGKTMALFDYAGTEEGDLSFNKDAEIFLLEKINENWFRGKLGDRSGIFPSNYVEVTEMYNLCVDSNQAKQASSSDVVNNDITEQSAVQKNCETVSSVANEVAVDIVKNEVEVVSNNNAQKDSISVSTLDSSNVEEIVSPLPKKKPSKPERPKLPSIRKSDEVSPFSYKFKTKSQPLVIIPQKYCKAGSNKVILKNWKNDRTVISAAVGKFYDKLKEINEDKENTVKNSS